ncbi:polysaccharide deacetylase family protein [Nocardiopsis sp. EMB25]|uniref:polysaccharide deacetylase family protein n=1 Tax=Nocardiopsis sp. EMB25 TaxID=2835867 RepID=UPI002284D118|nr:polysaccharide deacetylase family protein [Nocardiopsis sp. EMB25]MCY9782819.1 polysaccharide deacetylase family protein [Nocardiopsis sp. EMB25]
MEPSIRARQQQSSHPPDSGRGGLRRSGAAAVALALTATACGTATGDAESADRITVVLDEPEGAVTEWTGGSADYDGHPHIPQGLDVTVAYPEFEGAPEFADGLAELVDREVLDFRGASRDPVSLTLGWEVTAAGDGVLGVRLIRTEEDLHGLRQGYETYWYDAGTGLTHYSSELIAGQEELTELNEIVRADLAGRPDVDTGSLFPIRASYDSLGFNTDGDLVVEFDDGHLSPVREGHPPDSSPGRVASVVDSAEAEPLLSDLGERARAASLREEPDYAVPEPGRAPDPGRAVPGEVVAGDEDVDCRAKRVRCVALTFDDGPADTTAPLLDLLAEEEVTATFFLNADPALTRPLDYRRAYAAGHEIASHNDQHEHMPDMPEADLPGQVAAVSAIVSRHTGHTVRLFRPPFGDSSPEVLGEIGDQGMAQVLWNLDSEDWTGLAPDEIADRVVEAAERDSVVLLHDTLPPTVAAVPEIIERLREDGFVFATASQVIGDPEPGESYPRHGRVPGTEGEAPES